eukprot:gnl/TRDRNA2_/TRDRNA2_187537_c0_seq1.p1 gnl/TRDRNA2_/TRDRNA2_187537_c0~~gnl/TRDRNA2_/TRDRNA2_187537_c0_seq1.p1  ORF type:complete len:231 (+),score=69.80 gnl/TRDRNA2_/TRDRNA2_187537_c0_seq1:99-791(+)
MSKVFLDIDIDGELAAFNLGAAFVDANDIKYNLSSKDVLKCSGSELARLPELFACDFEWSQKGKALFRPPAQRVVIELDEKASPMACQNFKALCTGEKGKSKESGKDMHYKNVPFHRIVKGFMMQGGDFVTGTGAGGESIHGKKFKDDPGGLKLKLDKRGVVAMSNTGKNSNTCQFFITFSDQSKLTGKHVVLGKIVEGMEIIDRVEEETASEGEGKPKLPVMIVDCGVL